MKCSKCGTQNSVENNFCNNCGEKLEKQDQNLTQEIKESDTKESNQSNENTVIQSEVNVQNNANNIKNDSNTFLIIGIVMTFCCSMPFGVATILINELKYKKAILNNNQEDADSTRKIMIALIIVGIILSIIVSLFRFFYELGQNYNV